MRACFRGATAACLVQRVHQLTVDIELKLGMRRVSDPDGLGVLIARQPRHLPFGQAALAGDRVHDLELLQAARDGADEAIPPGACLIVVAAPIRANSVNVASRTQQKR